MEEKRPSKFKRFLKNTLPWKGDKAGEIVRKSVMLLSVVVLIVCAGYFANRYITRQQTLKINAELSEQVKKNEPDKNSDYNKFMEELQKKYPNVKFPEGILQKYATIYALNQDTVGWLTVPGTGIDTAVVQGDNNEFYLRHDFYKKYTEYGNPFLDYRNNAAGLSQNNVIYGHHMADGMLFAELIRTYGSVSSYKTTPVIEYNTIFKESKWKVIAAFYTNAKANQDNNYVFSYNTPSMSKESFKEFLKEIQQRSLYSTGVDVDENDKLLTLSTCSSEVPDGRFVVIARQVRSGESEGVNTNLAKTNSNPRYPQIWYDKRKKTNPFKDAAQWQPTN